MEEKLENKIYFFDTTLRDGQQTTGVDFSVDDKIKFSKALDDLGLDYIEGGWPGSCLLYTSPSPRDIGPSRMPSSA